MFAPFLQLRASVEKFRASVEKFKDEDKPILVVPWNRCAASFCQQVAEVYGLDLKTRGNHLPVSAARWQHVPRYVLQLRFIHNIANNSTTTKATENISIDLESLEFF